MPAAPYVRPHNSADLPRTVTGHMADDRRMVVSHYGADTRQACGRIEWLTSTLYGPDGSVIAWNGQQGSSRNLTKCPPNSPRSITDVTEQAERVDNDAASSLHEGAVNSAASLGREPLQTHQTC